MGSKIPDMHIIDGNYYNWNGSNPDKPLTKPYGKRLYNNQIKYNHLLTVKESSGHGKLSENKEHYKILATGKKKKIIKKSLSHLEKYEKNDLMNKIRNKEINTNNLRTRFRAGFRPYHIDDDGNTLDSYDSITYANALNGVIPLNRFLKELPNECFQDNTRGGFKIVVYDTETHEVYHSFEYGEQD